MSRFATRYRLREDGRDPLPDKIITHYLNSWDDIVCPQCGESQLDHPEDLFTVKQDAVGREGHFQDLEYYRPCIEEIVERVQRS